MRTVAVYAFGILLVACLSGCFGYNKSAKRWAFAGNTVLILGGGAVIAADVLATSGADPMMTVTGQPQAERYAPPISGGIIAGTLIASAGIIGILLNATRPNVKTSR